MTFGTITQEDREKGKQARLLKKQWALENLILDYEDEPSWQTLAKKHGVRLPSQYIPNNELKYMKRIMKKLGIDPKDYLDVCGVTTLKQLVKLNPTWNARAEIGLLLEYFDDSVNNP